MTLISAVDFNKRMDSDLPPVVIDVREPWEYEEYNLGVQNIPLNELPHRLEELDYCKQQEVIVHCQSGKRSNIAMKFLKKNGFANVKSLDGGIIAIAETII